METVSLYNAVSKDAPIKITPIDGVYLYDVSQLPEKLGFQFPDSDLICVDGDSLSKAICRAAAAAKQGRLGVCRCGLDQTGGYPYIEVTEINTLNLGGFPLL